MKYVLVLTAAIAATLILFSDRAGLQSEIAAQPPTDSAAVSPKILAFLKPIEAAAGDNELTKKLKERHNSAVALLDERIKENKKGLRDISFVYDAARLAAEAKLDLAVNAAGRSAVLEQTLDLAKLFETHVQQQFAKGFGSKADVERARYTRLSLEVELLRAKQTADPKPN